MQETRRIILDILRIQQQSTVEDIVAELQRRRGSITSVTVRHHLMRLQRDGFIIAPELRRRTTPGRPQHVYMLTEKAREQFPNKYQWLATSLLEEMRKRLPPDGVNVIIEGVADTLAGDVNIPLDLPFQQRLELVTRLLTEQGYQAYWEVWTDGYILHTTNCPYHQAAAAEPADQRYLCRMDMRLISSLLGMVPRRLGHMLDDGETCSYWVPLNSMDADSTESAV